MSLKRLALSAAILVCCAVPAGAQGVKLRFHNGLVSLSTQNAPLRAILAEWARQGGTTIVNAERVAGPPLSLELDAVPERQALDVLLRQVSGYIVAPRPIGTPGVSVFDRIMILPTSSAPANAAPAGRAFPQPRTAPQPVMPQPPVVQEPEELEEDPPQDVAPDDDATVVTPQLRPRPQSRDIIPGIRPQPFEIPPQEEPAEESQEAQPAIPGNPFGLPAGATSRPGIVTPVPQGPQQRTPRTDPEP
jgi:hypothetical protein